jgi:sigma-B regulation protein RsbU (phosphoserine phosphatase)
MSTVPPSFVPERTVPAPRASNPSLATTYRGYLDIQFRDGPVKRRVITEKQLIVGRSPSAGLVLDHDTVSRQHAEIFCDPLGRYGVRDLGSTNGTFVNDDPVSERLLSPSDWVQIGDYVLYFHVAPIAMVSVPPRPLAAAIAAEEPTMIGAVRGFEGPLVSSKHVLRLLDFGKRLGTLAEPRERLERLCELIVGSDFHGTLALVLRVTDAGNLHCLAGPLRGGGRVVTDESASQVLPYIAHGVLAKVRETGDPVLARNEIVSDRAPLAPRAVGAPSIIACPIAREPDAVELLYATFPDSVATKEWVGLVAMATQVYLQADLAWKAREHERRAATIEHELAMAQEIQRAALPRGLSHPGIDVAVGFEPCSWVGGDYVDVVPMRDGRVLLTVADVCGKGLTAALTTSRLHTLVRATIDGGETLTELARALSDHLHRYLPEHSFVTLVAVAIDPETGEIEHFNAGHPPVIVVHRNGTTRELPSAVGPPLGLGELPIELTRERLAAGEVLLLYTDGLTELRNASRAMLGLEALQGGFAKLCAASPELAMDALSDRLWDMLAHFSGGQAANDDRAFLLARRKV